MFSICKVNMKSVCGMVVETHDQDLFPPLPCIWMGNTE